MNITKPINTKENVTTRIKKLSQTRERWQENADKTAKQELYELLQGCFQLHADMSSTRTRDDFRCYLNTQGIRLRENTSTISMILRQVFGTAKRQRISSYSRALSVAEQNSVTPAQFVQFVNREGGLEALRLQNRNKRPSMSSLADAARTELATVTPLARVGRKQMHQNWGSASGDDYVLLLAEYATDGTFSIKRVLQSASLLKRALSACAATTGSSVAAIVPAVVAKQQRRRTAVNNAAQQSLREAA